MFKDSLVFFFFKQKTAYEMRISDWSSDVCSSDLASLSINLLPTFGALVMLPAIASAQQVSAKGGKFDRTAGNDVIVVTGRSLSTPDLMPPLPVQVLSGDDLAHRRQGGLGATLAGLPGVQLDNFGGEIGRAHVCTPDTNEPLVFHLLPE